MIKTSGFILKILFIFLISFFCLFFVKTTLACDPPLKACSEDYPEPCPSGGTRLCHKRGCNETGAGGPACPWGAGSQCGICEGAGPTSTPVPGVPCDIVSGGEYGYCNRDQAVGQGAGHCNVKCKPDWSWPASDPNVECHTVFCSCDNSAQCCRKIQGTPSPTQRQPTTPPGQPTNTPRPTTPPPTVTPTRRPTPSPTITPTPTKTPTPSPVQPTLVISQPASSSFSTKTSSQKPTQQWTCLKSEPCNNNPNCSGKGSLDHRVRLTTKTDAKLKPNRTTYVFECLQTTPGYQCTSGVAAVDEDIVGQNYVPSLSANYGYHFVKFTLGDGQTVINQRVNNLISTNANGEIGPFEWESDTRAHLGRIFMAVQKLTEAESLTGNEGGQQQATFDFGSGKSRTCVLIKWDPHGIVFDSSTKKPIENAVVTLFRKNDDGSFSVVSNKDVLSGTLNPVITNKNGEFFFSVPDSVYKLTVSKSGYVFDLKKYLELYQTEEIIQKTKTEVRNLPLKTITFFNSPVQYILDRLNALVTP